MGAPWLRPLPGRKPPTIRRRLLWERRSKSAKGHIVQATAPASHLRRMRTPAARYNLRNLADAHEVHQGDGMNKTSISYADWRSLKGRALGGLKGAAKRMGMTFQEYTRHLDAGEAWCTACKGWHSRSAFGQHRNRPLGLSQSCLASAHTGRPRGWHEHPRVNPATGRPGPAPNPARDGDRLQARRRINVEVRSGRRPHPNTLPCADCGHEWKPGDPRHSYDHHLGYTAAHHLDVQAVCLRCHGKRNVARGENTTPAVKHAANERGARRRRTTCRLGHPIVFMKDGKRRCRECRLAYWRRRNREKRGAS